MDSVSFIKFIPHPVVPDFLFGRFFGFGFIHEQSPLAVETADYFLYFFGLLAELGFLLLESVDFLAGKGDFLPDVFDFLVGGVVDSWVGILVKEV